jgi:Prokaryotic phospholipase A2
MRSRAFRSNIFLGLLIAAIAPACAVSGEAGGEFTEAGGGESNLTAQGRTMSGDADVEANADSSLSEEDVSSTEAALTSNGCSNPQFLEAIQQMLHPVPASLKTLFKPACDQHDYCYSSGKAFYNTSRATCDQRFGEDMMALCSKKFCIAGVCEPIALSACQLSATEFTAAVKVAGASHYEGTPCVSGQIDTTDCSTYEPFRSDAPNSKDIILYTTTAGSTYRVAGAPSSGSTLLAGTATSLSAYGFRSGYTTADNILHTIEGDPATAQVIHQGPINVAKYSGNRTAGIANNGLWIQEGGLTSPWTSNLSAFLFDLDQSRVVAASRGAEHAVWLKKGSLTNAWAKIWHSPSEEVQQLVVGGNTIAFTAQYRLHLTDDDGATWAEIPGDPWVDNTQTKVAGRRIGAVVGRDQNTRWELMVTEGDPNNATWYAMSANMKAWDTTPTRLAIIQGGRLWLQDGGLNQSWRDVGTAQSVKVSGNRVALLDGGKLYVKDGTVADSWTTRANWTLVASNVKNYVIWQKGDFDPKDYVNVIH